MAVFIGEARLREQVVSSVSPLERLCEVAIADGEEARLVVRPDGGSALAFPGANDGV